MGASAAPGAGTRKAIRCIVCFAVPLRTRFAALLIAAACSVAGLSGTAATTALASAAVGAVHSIAAIVTTISAITVLFASASVSSNAVIGELMIISKATLRAATVFIITAIAVIANLHPFVSLILVLLTALLCAVTLTVNERGLPLTVALCAPLTSAVTCGA